MPIAIPPAINASAANSDGSKASPRKIAPHTMPTTGVASNPSEVVTAGRLRLTINMAQCAKAVQTIPLNSSRSIKRGVQTTCGAPSTSAAKMDKTMQASRSCQNTSWNGVEIHRCART
jgi:hypothetical protein